MVCPICGEDKAIEEFYYRKSEGKLYRSDRCKNCDKLRKRAYKFKKKYGITIREWEQMYQSQNGKCAVCLEKPERLEVDHDHDTEKVRSLLCPNCNKALGLLKEDIEIIENLIKYLKSW